MTSANRFPIIQTGRILFFGLLTALLINLTGCTRDSDNDLPTAQNINELVTSNAQLTLLEAAVARANLGSALSGAGPLTVFAPTDAAFQAAGFADANAINQAAPATLTNILLYHVVSGTAVTASAIPTAQTAYPTSVSGNASMYVTKTSTGAVSVNGARVTEADVQASNGIIHVIDKVLLPPAGNVLQLAVADTSLSLLVAAAQRGGPAVTTALGGNTPLTVFAPTNAAFRLTPYNSVSAINAAPEAALTGILTNHVIGNARAYSPTLTNGGTVTTFGGGALTVTVGTSNTVAVTSRGNAGVASRVTTPDINATNGVIHKIDRVLLP